MGQCPCMAGIGAAATRSPPTAPRTTIATPYLDASDVAIRNVQLAEHLPMQKVGMKGHVRDVDVNSKVIIITHGGCPDGQASAFILQSALKKLKGDLDVQVIQGAHQGRISPANIDYSDAVIIFSDICPATDDSPAIAVARQCFVIDHHPTTEAAMAPLKKTPYHEKTLGDKIIDLSTNNGESCGASLAQEFCDGVFAMDRDQLEYHWNLDVFKHKVHKDLEPQFNAFKGWINQKGTRDCDLSLVEEMARDKAGCLKKGDKLYEPVRLNTRKTVAAKSLLHTETGLKVYVVDVDAAKAKGTIGNVPIDPMVYQEEIDKLKELGVAIAFLTVDRTVNPKSQSWNLGLRRAGDMVDMGKVAAALKEDAKAEGFAAGGGHAFAAGAQTTKLDLPITDVVRVVVAACRRCFT